MLSTTRNSFSLLFAAFVTAIVLLPGCPSTGIGDPCIPDREFDPTFTGFSVKEVITESGSFQCQTRVCLVNHFQGRVSCPEGQNEGESSCKVPGTDTKVEGSGNVSCVASQFNDRRAETTVYCSCRCANADGKTDDGANYCTCPDNFECKQLVTPTGIGNEGLTGAYCIKQGTEYNSSKTGAKINTSNTCEPLK